MVCFNMFYGFRGISPHLLRLTDQSQVVDRDAQPGHEGQNQPQHRPNTWNVSHQTCDIFMESNGNQPIMRLYGDKYN